MWLLGADPDKQKVNQAQLPSDQTHLFTPGTFFTMTFIVAALGFYRSILFLFLESLVNHFLGVSYHFTS